jgi:hypothetical protein
MGKNIFSFLILAVAACGHVSGSETEDGLLRVYPDLVSNTSEQTAVPVAKVEAVAVAALSAPEPDLIEQPLSSLAVRVKGAKRCRVRVGDERFGKAPFRAKPVAPGTHRIFVKCPGRKVYSEVLDFYPGEPKKLHLKRADFRKSRRVARKN